MLARPPSPARHLPRFRGRLAFGVAWLAGALCAAGAMAVFTGSITPVAAQSASAPSYEEFAVRIAILARDARYAEALTAAEEFARVAKSRDGVDTIVYASAIAWVGHLYQKQGRLAEAEPLMDQSLKIFKKILPAGHPNIATATSNLGFQYQLSGRYEEAEKLYKAALEMREKTEFPNYEHIAESLNNLAQIYKRQWRVAESIPLLKRAVEMRERLHGPEDRQVALGLANLAAAFEMQMQIAEAEPTLRRAVAILEKRQPADHPELAGTRNKLAQNLYKQGKFEEAEPLFRQALAAWRKPQNAGATELPATLADLASNLVQQKKLDEAETLFREALDLTTAVLPPTHPTIARMYMGLSDVFVQRGNTHAALQAIRQASAVRLARRSNDDLSRLTYQKHVRIAWMAAAEMSGRASRRLIDEGLEMAQRATQTETAVAVQTMTARFAARDGELQALVRQREDLDNEMSQLEQQLSAALALPREKRGKADEQISAQIAANTKQIETIDADLKRRFPEYFSLVKPEPLDTTKVRSMLGSDEALVVMMTGYDQTHVIAVTREDAAWHKVDLTVDELTDAVNALRESLDVETLKASFKTKPKLFDLSLANHLYDKLLKPIEALIEGKQHLVTVPFGPLSSLPLQVLITGGPTLAHPEIKNLPMYQEAHWLARRHAVSVLPSVGSLEGLRVVAKRPVVAQKPFIGFGNPRFGAPAPTTAEGKRGGKQGAGTRTAELTTARAATRTRSFTSYWRGGSVNPAALRELQPLPETEGELKTVARHLKASERDLRTGAAATETTVKQMDLSQYRIVYFATHGLVAGEISGLAEPALALTPPLQPTALDDGLLTASEVAHLRLNADWVVLAACNTAAGDTPGAEALSGLARAFFYAGARALLVSHWRVGSEAAAKLTTSTFEIQQASTGIGRAEALRRAMVQYMDTKGDSWAAYPAFWAPFSVVGEGGR